MRERTPLRHAGPGQAEAEGLIEGRNAVTEALRAGKPIDKIYLAKGETDAWWWWRLTGASWTA